MCASYCLPYVCRYSVHPSKEKTALLILIEEFAFIGSEGCVVFGHPRDSGMDPAVAEVGTVSWVGGKCCLFM